MSCAKLPEEGTIQNVWLLESTGAYKGPIFQVDIIDFDKRKNETQIALTQRYGKHRAILMVVAGDKTPFEKGDKISLGAIEAICKIDKNVIAFEATLEL